MGLCQCKQNTSTRDDVMDEYFTFRQPGALTSTAVQGNQRLINTRVFPQKAQYAACLTAHGVYQGNHEFEAYSATHEMYQGNQELPINLNVYNETGEEFNHSERESVSYECEEPLYLKDTATEIGEKEMYLSPKLPPVNKQTLDAVTEDIFPEHSENRNSTRKKRKKRKWTFIGLTNRKRKRQFIVDEPFVVERQIEKNMESESYVRVRRAKTRDIQVCPSPVSSIVTDSVMTAISEIAKHYPGFNFVYTTAGAIRRDIPVFFVCERKKKTLLQDVFEILDSLLKLDIDLRSVKNCCLIILKDKMTPSCAGAIKRRLSHEPVNIFHIKVVEFIYDENGWCKINEDTLKVLNKLLAEEFIKETVFVYSKTLTDEISNISTYLSGLLDLSLEHKLEVVQVLPENQKIIVPCVDLYRDFENLQAALSGIPTPYHPSICIVYIHHTEPHVVDRKNFRIKENIKDSFTVGEIVDCVYKGDFILYACSLNTLASKQVCSFLTDSKDWPNIGHTPSKRLKDTAQVKTEVVGSDEFCEKRMPSMSSLHEALPEIKPWRKVNIDNLPEEKFFQRLKYDIKRFDTLERINILNIGYIGAGKSSFVNTITSTVEGHVARPALSGIDPKNKTTTLAYYGFDEFPHISLWDTRGIDSEYGLGSTDFECLLNGNIEQGYEFHKTKPITKENVMYNSNPSLADKPHVVCFVFDGNILQGLLKEDRHANNLKEFIEHVEKSRGMRYVILLTKMDKVCSIVETDSSKVYTSKTVESLVKGMAACLNIEPSRFVPIVNYNSNDTETNISTNIVALIALRQLLRNANDFIANSKQGR